MRGNPQGRNVRIARLLSEQTHFVKLGVSYTICSCCGHLNGANQDTESFCNAVYASNDGKSYARNYSASDIEAYRSRVRDIYLPKARFLEDALIAEGRDPSALSYADLGAGSGYFRGSYRARLPSRDGL